MPAAWPRRVAIEAWIALTDLHLRQRAMSSKISRVGGQDFLQDHCHTRSVGKAKKAFVSQSVGELLTCNSKSVELTFCPTVQYILGFSPRHFLVLHEHSYHYFYHEENLSFVHDSRRHVASEPLPGKYNTISAAACGAGQMKWNRKYDDYGMLV